MTDIVERLRALNADFLHEEAADEIERLRAEIVLLEATGVEAADEIERLRAERDALKVECYAVGENYKIAKREQLFVEARIAAARREGIERLRAALRRIANGDFCAQHMSSPPICVRAYEARLVLGEKHHD